MTIEIVTVACRTDNYAFLIHNPDSGQTALVDAPESRAILSACKQRGWTLDTIAITHHHDDHIEGVADLVDTFGCKVIGAASDAHRLPPLDQQVSPGDTFSLCGQDVHVIDVSGHTVGHIAFHMPTAQAVFTADSLMALGCGRVFEGTFDQMWDSLSRLAALPADTVVYSGHEYTAANGRFAATIEPDNPDLNQRLQKVNAARAENRATVPSLLSLELATNPFLRAGQPSVKRSLGMENEPDSAVFAEIRARKDRF